MPIPKKMREEMANDDYYKFCARLNEGNCSGRITFEHALIYAGKQIQEKFAILPICEYHHSIGKHMDDGDLNKSLHHYLAISRMTTQDKIKYPKRDWDSDLELLEKKHG